MKHIDRILIPSGPSERIDIQRVNKTLDKYDSEENYAILGAGPDIYKALNCHKAFQPIPAGLDHHLPMYLALIKNNRVPVQNVELVTASKTAVQNLLEFFKNERKGYYVISSDEWQLKKYRHIYNVLKKKGKISEEVELEDNIIKTSEYYGKFKKILSWAKSEIELMGV